MWSVQTVTYVTGMHLELLELTAGFEPATC